MSEEAREAPITLVVADDYPLYLEGLCQYLENDARFDLVGTAVDGPGAIELCAQTRPMVAFVGYFLPGQRGAALLQGLMEASERTSVVVLAGIEDPDLVHSAVALGARGYLVKQEPGGVILDALNRVGRGGSAFSSVAEGCLLDAIRAGAEDSDSVPSPRESQILSFLAGGATSREVAQRLYLSEATVKSHLSRLYRKLGVNDRSAAVAEAMRRDWVS